MKMLENELGLDLMNTCLRQLVKERVGKVTDWSDIEKSFSATAGRPLSWFFDQWVRGSEFPAVAMDRHFVENGPNGGFNTNLIFSQKGTTLPFRLKFEVVMDMPDGAKRFPITMTKRQEQFDLPTPQKPSRITVNTFGWTLADGPPPVTPDGTNLARR
jgi:aminopeptidase N